DLISAGTRYRNRVHPNAVLALLAARWIRQPGGAVSLELQHNRARRVGVCAWNAFRIASRGDASNREDESNSRECGQHRRTRRVKPIMEEVARLSSHHYEPTHASTRPDAF